MKPESISLVQESWKQVVPIADQAAALFYEELFTLDPSLKRLFKSDIKAQGRKLTSMINTAVVNLAKLETILPAVQDLGRRHVGYGVEAAHYGTVGTALIATLEKGLGGGFTPEVRAAWVEAYTVLATVMQDAAAGVAAKSRATAMA
jgi:hemoglobin-like flavoprotein